MRLRYQTSSPTNTFSGKLTVFMGAQCSSGHGPELICMQGRWQAGWANTSRPSLLGTMVMTSQTLRRACEPVTTISQSLVKLPSLSVRYRGEAIARCGDTRQQDTQLWLALMCSGLMAERLQPWLGSARLGFQGCEQVSQVLDLFLWFESEVMAQDQFEESILEIVSVVFPICLLIFIII